jgi:hypothetical protein
LSYQAEKLDAFSAPPLHLVTPSSVLITSSPFVPLAFQVVPGASDKVLLYFQGGGACWDEASTKAGLCTTDCSPQKPVGIFDRTEATNAYKDYTIVHVSYCSGDLFGGDIVRDYTDSAGVPVTQKGYANGLSAVNWIQSQQASGALASSLSDFVVMGCSAGSIGAQIWSDNALNFVNWKQVSLWTYLLVPWCLLCLTPLFFFLSGCDHS